MYAVMGRHALLSAGMWYSLALFYDSEELGPAYATVAMATGVASVLGGPIAAGLLMFNGLGGLHGWQVRALDVAGPCLHQFKEVQTAISTRDIRDALKLQRWCSLHLAA